MSQRLLICLKENIQEDDSCVDYIYTEDGTLEGLLAHWIMYDQKSGFYLGPWRIIIRDYDIMDQFMEHFKEIKKYCTVLKSLRDCWTVYDEELGKCVFVNEKENQIWSDALLKLKDLME